MNLKNFFSKTNCSLIFFICLHILFEFIFLETGYQSCYAENKKTKISSFEKMKQTYQNTKTLTTEFIQSQKNVTLGDEKRSTGRIFIKRPNKFIWQTLDPNPSQTVSNGFKVWMYTPPFRKEEKGQIIVRQVAQAQSKLAIDLISGQSKIENDFKINKINDSTWKLIPKKPIADIESIELQIDMLTNLVYKLSLTNKTGNQTALEFKNMVLNPELEDSTFQFKVPPNTEEIR